MISSPSNGNGTLTDTPASAGEASSGRSTSAALIDYDRDGLLYLAMIHYVDFYRRPCYMSEGRLDYCGPSPFQGTETELYRNLGNGRFQNVTDLKEGTGQPCSAEPSSAGH